MGHSPDSAFGRSPQGPLPLHHGEKGKFKNVAVPVRRNISFRAMLWRLITEKRTDTKPRQSLPISHLTRSMLETIPRLQDTLIRLGHSSIYLQLNGQKWLIDPVFSQRASPFRFIGPRRFHPPPIDLTELPPLDGILLTHDHYDHLDKATIRHLSASTARFVVPVGLDKTLRKWGVAGQSITTLDWWQSTILEGLTITATPAQHFSGRGLFDKNRSLWASYVIQTSGQRLFFSGDSGYFNGFKQIGEKFGPFDLTMIETGAYDHYWPDVHMTPEQSLQAHMDLNGQQMMPIHNSTFNLAFHPWYEPLERICALAEHYQQSLFTPTIGQIVPLAERPATTAWWKPVS